MNEKDKNIWLVAGVAVEYKGKYLITQQGQGTFHEGKWAIPGGCVEPKATILENAKREVLEETGLKVKITGLLGILRKELKAEKEGDPEGLLINFLYHGKSITDKVIIRKDEISNFKWLNLKELKNFPPKDLRPVMKFVIEKLEELKLYPSDIINEEKQNFVVSKLGKEKALISPVTTLPSKRKGSLKDHPSFGMWKNRQDLKDSAKWVSKLRERQSKRLK